MKKLILLFLFAFTVQIVSAQHVTKVENSGDYFKITWSSGKIETVSKVGAKVVLQGTVLTLMDLRGGSYLLRHTHITNPVAVTAAALATIISSYANTLSGTLIDSSGTCSGASKLIIPANTGRKAFFIQNISGGGGVLLYVNFGSAAAAAPGSYMLQPGESISSSTFVSTDSIYIFGSSSMPYTAKFSN